MKILPGLNLPIPIDWDVSDIESVTSKVGSGATPRGGASVYLNEGTAFIRSQNVHDHEFKQGGLAYLSDEAAHSLRGVTVHVDDVLINITGDSILRTTIVPPEVLPARVNQHVAIVRSNGAVHPVFLQKWLSTSVMKDFMLGHSSGGTRKAITKGHLLSLPVPLPSLPEQREIAALLSALDNKIESNKKSRTCLRALGDAKYLKSLDEGVQTKALNDVTLSIARGVTPRYADEDSGAPVVINQKCIRDGWVSLAPSRRMHDRKVSPAKCAVGGDILINSTGTGTLGRVARWHEGQVFVDSHVSVVRPDPQKVEPIMLAYALLGRQVDIEALSTGSTGQTELSPKRLGDLDIAIPSRTSTELVPELLAIEERAHQLAAEIDRLVAVRDALLPELLSGRLRLPVEGVSV